MELLQSVLSSNDENSLPGFLQFCFETRLFCSEKNKCQDVASFINSLFSKVENKDKVLLVLQTFIPQCPRNVLDSNILSWIQQCSKLLIDVDGSINNISFQLLGDLLQLSTDFPEVRKEIALSVIPKCLEQCIREVKSQKEDIQGVLRCLEQTIHYYGKTSGMHKGELTSLVFSLLESSPLTVYTSAKCYLYLAASGSPGTNNENYANNWELQQKFLLNMLNSLLDSLFENIEVHQDAHKHYDLGDYQPVFPKITEKNLLRRKQRLASQFQSVAEFLCVHLLGSFPASKKVLPQSILSVVWRGLSVNCSTLRSTNMTADVSNLSAVISKINLSCLKILNAITKSCRKNLISFSSFICRMISQILNWTNVQNWPYGVGKPHWAIRAEAYSCVLNWLIVSQASSGINKYISDILSSIISDIDIKQPIVTLKVSSGKGKKKKQLKKKEVPTTLEFMVNKDENPDVCQAALELIPVMLSSTSTIMKPEQHKLLQQVIVSKLLDIQNQNLSQAPIPYSCENCRLVLYEALLSLCNNYHPSLPPPINYATNIFSKGMKDTSMKVIAFCAHAQSNIQKILKPPYLSLEFPTILNDGPSNSAEKINVRESFIADKSYFNSTHKEGITNESFIVSPEKSDSIDSSRITDIHTESLPLDGDDQLSINGTEKEIAAKSSVDNEIDLTLNEDEVEETPVEYDVETFPTNTPPKTSDDKNIESGNMVSPGGTSKDSQISNTEKSLGDKNEKKRDLEENEVGTSSSKKGKMDGIDKDSAITVDDSDEEMLNSFVDEVIEV